MSTVQSKSLNIGRRIEFVLVYLFVYFTKMIYYIQVHNFDVTPQFQHLQMVLIFLHYLVPSTIPEKYYLFCKVS